LDNLIELIEQIFLFFYPLNLITVGNYSDIKRYLRNTQKNAKNSDTQIPSDY